MEHREGRGGSEITEVNGAKSLDLDAALDYRSSPMKRIQLDKLALIPLIGGTLAALLFVPELPFGHLDDPAYQAVPGTVLILAAILVTRAFGPRAARVERGLFAYFLAVMPIVYISSLVRSPGGMTTLSLGLQVLGLVLFAAAALVGFFVWAWALPLGIAAHGLVWDLAHRHAGFIPRWYTDACLVIDLAFALYALSRVRAWQLKAKT